MGLRKYCILLWVEVQEHNDDSARNRLYDVLDGHPDIKAGGVKDVVEGELDGVDPI